MTTPKKKKVSDGAEGFIEVDEVDEPAPPPTEQAPPPPPAEEPKKRRKAP